MNLVASSDLVRTVATSLTPETGRIARAITDRVRADVIELRGIAEPAFWEAVEQGTRANLDAGLAMMAGGRPAPRDPPLDASFVVRMVAARGVSLSSVLHAYRIGHRVAWDEWVRAVEALEVSVGERASLLEWGSSMLFDFVDRIAMLVSEEHTHTLESAVRDREQRRLQRVRDLIDGAAADTRDLDYDLAAEHVAIVGSGEGVEPALRAVAGEVELRLLLVRVEPGLTWAWLGGRELDARPWRAVLDRNAPGEATFGIADVGAGLAGFRASHQQAQDAARIGRRLGIGVCYFHAVALEALALRDEQFARRFVAHELRGFNGPDDRARKLRDTLRAYFASGHNAAAAAAVLGVHDQTITYRLRHVEKCLGEPVSARRAELELALRMERMLAAGDGE